MAEEKTRPLEIAIIDEIMPSAVAEALKGTRSTDVIVAARVITALEKGWLSNRSIKHIQNQISFTLDMGTISISDKDVWLNQVLPSIRQATGGKLMIIGTPAAARVWAQRKNIKPYEYTLVHSMDQILGEKFPEIIDIGSSIRNNTALREIAMEAVQRDYAVRTEEI